VTAGIIGLVASVSFGVQSSAPIRFRDVAQGAGLRFVLENNPTPQKHMFSASAQSAWPVSL
jgi:hypothetical protein